MLKKKKTKVYNKIAQIINYFFIRSQGICVNHSKIKFVHDFFLRKPFQACVRKFAKISWQSDEWYRTHNGQINKH